MSSPGRPSQRRVDRHNVPFAFSERVYGNGPFSRGSSREVTRFPPMGPTNIALVNLFRADQALREAQERLDAASKNVRVQERRVNDLLAKQKVAQQALMQAQTRASQQDLDLKTRD